MTAINPTDIFERVRSGVCQIVLESSKDRVASGTGFLVKEGLVTASHVLREAPFETLEIQFEGSDSARPLRLLRADVEKAVRGESSENEADFVFLALAEPEFQDRYLFELGDATELRCGEQVAFLGYPFGISHLTAHVGFVSALYESAGVRAIQVDGSVNGGNSGGPLINMTDGRVVGIITRSQTGLLVEQFDELIRTLRANQEVCNNARGGLAIGGINPVAAIGASQRAMELIAVNLRRSANVGIGIAFDAAYVSDAIATVA